MPTTWVRDSGYKVFVNFGGRAIKREGGFVWVGNNSWILHTAPLRMFVSQLESRIQQQCDIKCASKDNTVPLQG